MVRSIMVTGHRPGKLGGYTVNPIASRIRRELHDIMARTRHRFGSCVGITGLAQGVDQWFAEVCRALSIPYIGYIPFPGQERLWPSDAQDHYRQLVAEASEVHIGPSAGTKPEVIAALHRRNSEMVSTCHAAIAVWNGSAGGTVEPPMRSENSRTSAGHSFGWTHASLSIPLLSIRGSINWRASPQLPGIIFHDPQPSSSHQ